MTDTKITTEEARMLVTLLIEDAVFVDHNKTHDTLHAYISQSEREIAELRNALHVTAEESTEIIGDWRERAEKAEAAAAEMRATLTGERSSRCTCTAGSYENTGMGDSDRCGHGARLRNALSQTAGTGWRSPAEWGALVAERDEARHQRDTQAAMCAEMRAAITRDASYACELLADGDRPKMSRADIAEATARIRPLARRWKNDR